MSRPCPAQDEQCVARPALGRTLRNRRPHRGTIQTRDTGSVLHASRIAAAAPTRPLGMESTPVEGSTRIATVRMVPPVVTTTPHRLSRKPRVHPQNMGSRAGLLGRPMQPLQGDTPSMSAPRNASIPAALRPRPVSADPPQPAPTPVATPVVPASGAPVIHLALVVPDVRIQKLLTEHCYVIGPTTQRARVTVHAVLDDKSHPATQLDKYVRWALVETGLVPPEEAGYVNAAQVELGWPTHEKDTA